MKQLLTLMLAALILFTSCTNYGKKAKSGNIEVYYKDGATKEQAQKTADLFLQALQASDPNDKATKSFQLTKPGDTLLMKMVVGDKARMTAAGDDAFYAMVGLISDSVYNGKPVNISFTDNKFKAFRTLTYNPARILNFGVKVTSGNVEVYSKDGFSSEHAQMLADFLSKEMQPANTISFQVGMPEGQVYQIYMASSPEKAKNVTTENIQDLCSKMSKEVFNGVDLNFHFTDVRFKPFLSYSFDSVTDTIKVIN